MVKEALRRLVRRVDDICVRRKLMVSYVLGFLVPIVTACVALSGMTAARIRRDSEQRIAAVVDVVRGQLYGNFRNVLQLVDLLHSDDVARTTLDERRFVRVFGVIPSEYRSMQTEESDG
jgi:hypothetical protein